MVRERDGEKEENPLQILKSHRTTPVNLLIAEFKSTILFPLFVEI